MDTDLSDLLALLDAQAAQALRGATPPHRTRRHTGAHDATRACRLLQAGCRQACLMARDAADAVGKIVVHLSGNGQRSGHRRTPCRASVDHMA